jgi:hypothetical protein
MLNLFLGPIKEKFFWKAKRPYEPAIPVLENEKLHSHKDLHSSSTHNGQKLKTTKCPLMGDYINTLGLWIS